MKDLKTLRTLVEKYGAATIKSEINEAFKSDFIRKVDNKFKKEYTEKGAEARAKREDKLDRARRWHFDGEDVDIHDLYNTVDKGARNEEAYKSTVQWINYDFDNEINSAKLVKSLKSLFNRFGLNFVEWSKVEDINIGQCAPMDAIKYSRRDKEFKFIVFWEDENDGIIAITSGPSIVWAKRTYRDYKSRELVRDIAMDWRTDKAYILDVRQYNKRHEKSNDRKNARYGQILNTPEDNRAIARENINRYKMIIAKNKIEKFDNIDRDVKQILKDSTEFYKAFDNISADNVGDYITATHRVSELVKKVLARYHAFCVRRKTLMHANDKVFSADELNRELTSSENDIYNVINQLRDVLTEILER